MFDALKVASVLEWFRIIEGCEGSLVKLKPRRRQDIISPMARRQATNSSHVGLSAIVTASATIDNEKSMRFRGSRVPHWVVEHCVGPLGVGTLVVKPTRHVSRVSELSRGETLQLGPLLHQTAAVVEELTRPAQVYVCLWSHNAGEPVHIHYVIQPIHRELVEEHGLRGPALQAEMFERGDLPSPADVEDFAALARAAFAERSGT